MTGDLASLLRIVADAKAEPLSNQELPAGDNCRRLAGNRKDWLMVTSGAADGVRTRDFQNHNLALLPAELQPP